MATISKAIGPTFLGDVAASSLAGAPFSWGPYSVDWPDGALTATQISALTTLVNAHDPNKKLPRLASGKQICEAIADLGFSSAWKTAIGGAKHGDIAYWYSKYGDLIPENSVKLGRIVSLAVGAGAAALTVGSLFDNAVT
jgi:hypothetical protein